MLFYTTNRTSICAGRVVIPTAISIAGDFCVGFPAALAFMFLAPFRLYGFYVALIVAHALKARTRTVQSLIIYYKFICKSI